MKKCILLMTLVCALTMPACGSSGNYTPLPTAVISVFQPELVYSHKVTSVRLLGSGFGARSTKVTLRFTAENGTPFAGGTQSSHEVEAIVESDSQIRTDLDPTLIETPFDAFITVVYSNGTEAALEGPATRFEPQEVLSITPGASADTGVKFLLTGAGFFPPKGSIRLRFTAETGTPFNGGGSATIEATGSVETTTTISGIFPNAGAAVDAPSFVSIFTQGGDEIKSDTPILTFFPVPTVLGFNPSVAISGGPIPFTISGSAFAPIGSTATIIMRPEATSSTPFANGTRPVHTFTGTVNSPSQISGVMPDPDVDSVFFARVDVTLSTGGRAVSALPLAQFRPAPNVLSISPNMITSGDSSYAFLITGTDFSPTSGLVTVNLVADAGTPFTNGTVTSISAPGQIISPTQIACTFSVDPDVDAQALCTVGVDFATVSASSASGALTIDPVPPFTAPAWYTPFGTSIAGVSDDSSTQVTFTGGFTFDFYGSNYSSTHFGSNGYLSMGFFSDLSENGSAGGGTIPTIQGWWDDLDPDASSSPGDTFFTQLSDRAVFTWDRIHEFSGSVDHSFQIQLWDTGRIDIVYNGMGASDGQIGIHGGGSGTAVSKDFSSVVHPARDMVGSGYPFEQFSTGCDFDPGWIVFEPDGTGGYNWATGP